MTIQDLFIYSIYVYDLGLAIVEKKLILPNFSLSVFLLSSFFLKKTNQISMFFYIHAYDDVVQVRFFSGVVFSLSVSLPYLYLLSGTLIIYTKEREKEKRIEFVFFL